MAVASTSGSAASGSFNDMVSPPVSAVPPTRQCQLSPPNPKAMSSGEMLLAVRTIAGNFFWLDVKRDSDISEVKLKIREYYCIPEDDQRLRRGDQKLTNCDSLSDYGVRYRGQLEQPIINPFGPPIILYLHRTSMKIQVTTTTSMLDTTTTEVLYFEVTTTTTVLDLKTKIQQSSWCIPPSKQRLFWQEQQLEDANKLEDYDIQMEVWPQLRLEKILQRMTIAMSNEDGNDTWLQVCPPDTVTIINEGTEQPLATTSAAAAARQFAPYGRSPS